MFTERMYRWPDSKEHFTKTFIKWCGKNIHNTIMSKTGLTSYAVAISDDCDCRKVENFDNLSTIDKYREYIRHDKDFATWTLRWRPTWY
jgi:hypothetical protein